MTERAGTTNCTPGQSVLRQRDQEDGKHIVADNEEQQEGPATDLATHVGPLNATQLRTGG